MIFALLMVFCLTGCAGVGEAGEGTSPEALAILVGNHACSKELYLEHSEIAEKVEGVIRAYGDISVVSVDGSPSLVEEGSYDIPDQYKGADESRLKADAESKAYDLMMRLHEIEADDEEVDTLEALRVAADTLSFAQEGAGKTIIVVDTGLSTSGILNFNNNLMYGEPEAIVELLDEKSAIPDLTDMEIYWYQLGEVAAPQQELSPRQIKKLEDIWNAIIEKGGGRCDFRYPKKPEGYDKEEKCLPMVTTVELQAEEPVRLEAPSVEKMDFDEAVFLDEEQIRFQGDSDIYAEPDKALMAIEPVAEYMSQHGDFELLLVGTTAGDEDSAYVRELSFARANAVKNSLISLGVSRERMIVVGLGNQDKWHLKGVGTSGELAAQNRKVVLLDAGTEEAMEIIRSAE